MSEPQPGFPEPAEYPSVLAGYVALTRDVIHPLAVLEDQRRSFVDFCNALDPALRLHRYGPAKWSIQQMLGHIIDTERTFAYRALRIGRGDPAPNPPFDENAYALAAEHESAPWPELVQEFNHVRASTLLLLRHLPSPAWRQIGAVAGGIASVRALAHGIIGHLEHHRVILRDRYLQPLE